MIERVKLLMSVKNLSSSMLAEEIGVQRSGISHILSGRNKPSLDFVLKVLEHYPEVSESWLLSGNGEMFKPIETDTKPISDINDEVNAVVNEPITEINEEDRAPYEIAKNFMPELDIEKEDHQKTTNLNDDYSTKQKRLVKLIAIYSDNSFKIYHSE